MLHLLLLTDFRPRESKPSFIIPPRRQFIDEGGRAKFKTSFDGEPEPTVTWMKDKAVLKNGGKYKVMTAIVL